MAIGRTDSPDQRWFRWRFPIVVVVVFGLLAVFLPGILAGLGDAVKTVVDPTSRVAADLAELPGIASVSAPESRAGDLTFRNNVFFTVSGTAGMSADAEDSLADTISATLAEAQGDTRYMVELDLGAVSVGISPVAALNAPRIALARSLSQIAGVVRTTVLWRTNDDDLITDEDNEGLDVFIQASAGAPLDLIEQALPLTYTADAPLLTAIILGDASPRERLYSWGDRDGPAQGERQVTMQVTSVSDPVLRQTIGALDVSDDVVGYSVWFTGASISFAEGVDVRQALASLAVPVEWVVLVSTPEGGERWTWTAADPAPAGAAAAEPVGWQVVE